MKNSVTRSTLFLTELIIDLFIFIVCCTVCTGLLVQANRLSRESSQLTDAVYIAQSGVESMRSGQIYQPDSVAHPGYELQVSDPVHGANGMVTYQFTVNYEGNEVYSLTSSWIEGGGLA